MYSTSRSILKPMVTKLRGTFQDFEIRAWQDLRPGEVARSFSSVFSALRFLRGFMHDPFSMTVMREAATSRSLWTAPLFKYTDHEILQQLAWQLAAGHLCVVPMERSSYVFAGGKGPATGPEEPHVDEPPAQPHPIPPQEPETPIPGEPVTTHWIRFQIIDYDTETPVAGVDLHLKMPDGTVSTYTTDDQGLVHLIGIPAGTCDLEQILDDEALEVVHQT